MSFTSIDVFSSLCNKQFQFSCWQCFVVVKLNWNWPQTQPCLGLYQTPCGANCRPVPLTTTPEGSIQELRNHRSYDEPEDIVTVTLSPGHPVTLVRPGWSPRGMRRIRGVARLRLNGHCDIVGSKWKICRGLIVGNITWACYLADFFHTKHHFGFLPALSCVPWGFLNGSSLEQNSHAELVGYLWPKLYLENFRCQPPSGESSDAGAGHEVLSWKYKKT